MSWLGTNWQKLLIWAVIALVFLIWVCALAGAAGLLSLHGPTSLLYAVAVFGVGLTIIAGTLWTGDVTRALPLTPGTGKALWAVVVVGVLSVTPGVYKAFMETPACPSVPVSPPRIRLDNVLLLKEDGSNVIPADLQVRGHSIYKGRKAPILLVAVVSDAAPNTSGKCQLEVTVSLENPSRGVAELQRWEKGLSRLDQWAELPDAASRKALFPNWQGRLVYVALLAQRADIGDGIFTLRVGITDKVTGLTDSVTVPVTIQS